MYDSVLSCPTDGYFGSAPSSTRAGSAHADAKLDASQALARAGRGRCRHARRRAAPTLPRPRVAFAGAPGFEARPARDCAAARARPHARASALLAARRARGSRCRGRRRLVHALHPRPGARVHVHRRAHSCARRGHVWSERSRRVAVSAAEAVQGSRCGGALVLAGMSHAVMGGLECAESALPTLGGLS
jgi:hypothetical protein